MDTKSVVLARACDAIPWSQTRLVGSIPRNYIRSGENPPDSRPVIGEVIEKLEGYSAEVTVAFKDMVTLDAIDELLGEMRPVVALAGLPEDYERAAARGGRVVMEDPHEEAITTLDLNEINAVLTCSRVNISISRATVLDGEPNQGRWAISLVPDRHVVILEHKTIMPVVPQTVDVLGEHLTHPMTWITGGSTTSDIELICVSGVHDPRSLRVVIAH